MHAIGREAARKSCEETNEKDKKSDDLLPITINDELVLIGTNRKRKDGSEVMGRGS